MTEAPIVNNTLTVDAVTYYNYSTPLEIAKREIKGRSETSFLAPTEILVKTKYAALNPVDVCLWQLCPKWLKRGQPKGFGGDFSGVVLQTGSEVKSFKAGDKIYGDILSPYTPYGSFANYQVIDVTKQTKIAKVPEELPMEKAAGIVIPFATAYELITRHKNLKDANVLVLGGGTSVGMMGLQIVRHLGAKYILTTSSSKSISIASDFGAHETVDYHDKEEEYKQIVEAAKKHGKFDLIFDTCRDEVLLGRLKDVLKTKREGGKYIQVMGSNTMSYGTVRYTDMLPSRGNLREQILSKLGLSNYDFAVGNLSDGAGYAKAVSDMWENRQFNVLVDTIYKFEEFKKAVDKFQNGYVKGKLLVEFN
ncbi:hypothetical protein KL907_001724 [Ogataea polymorpha]|nr:hypothetical protein KL907_001724 [Ogataea polymorpha]